MTEFEESRTQHDALRDATSRPPTEKSLKSDGAMRLLLAAAMREHPPKTKEAGPEEPTGSGLDKPIE
jgi:hypothetical protein